MPKIEYESKKFGAERLLIIEQANGIIDEYRADGFDLTLRQLYYQFVSRDLLGNTQQNYKRLGAIVSDARRAGLIDWSAIVDRTRELQQLPHWDSPNAVIAEDARWFRYDRWEDQPYYVEVWFEKDALMGVFERIAHELRLPFFSCRGYSSDSEMWAAGQRLADRQNADKEIVVLHFGDHDPSGIDMTRDIEARLKMFDADRVEVRRMALNMDQVRRYKPPPNPAKESDSRFANYRTQYGNKSWELDALDPKVLATIVRREVESLTDDDLWEAAIEREDKARAELSAISTHYDFVVKKLAGRVK